MRKYQIPDYPTINTAILLRWSRNKKLIFPPCETQTRYYYYARNAIWHLMLNLGIKPHETVLMPSYHNGMEVAPLIELGIDVELYRVDANMQIDFDDLEERINEKTKVLYIIHYLGFPQDLEKILKLKQKYGLFVIEDCALAFLSKKGNRPLGSFGDAGIFCFYKTIPVPNGGAVILKNCINNDNWPEESPDSYSCFNSVVKMMLQNIELRFPALNALTAITRSLASSTLKRIPLKPTLAGAMQFDCDKVNWTISSISKRILKQIDSEWIIKRRRANFDFLAKNLPATNGISLLFTDLPTGVCPLFFPTLYEGNKQNLVQALNEHRVGAIDFWSWRHPCVDTSSFSESEYLRDHVLELPIHQDLEQHHLECICEVVQQCTKAFH